MHVSGTFPRFSKVSDRFNSPKLLFLPAKRLEIALFCVWNEKTVCQKKAKPNHHLIVCCPSSCFLSVSQRNAHHLYGNSRRNGIMMPRYKLVRRISFSELTRNDLPI